MQSLWNYSHIEDWLANKERFWFTTTVNLPFGSPTAFHTLLEGINIPITFLFSDIFSPFGLYNITLLVVCGLNYLAGFRLFYHLSGHYYASVILSAAFMINPFAIEVMSRGQINILSIFSLALFFEFLTRLISKKGGVILVGAASLTLAAYTNLYYLYYICLASGITLPLLLVKDRRLFLSGTLAILLGLILSSPRIISTSYSLQPETYTLEHNPDKYVAKLDSYLLPGRGQIIGKLTKDILPKKTKEKIVLYPGIILTIAAIYLSFLNFREKKFPILLLLVTALFFLQLSIGGWLYQAMSYLPFFPKVPHRFGVMVTIILLSLVAMLARRKEILFLSTMILLEYTPVPMKHIIPTELYISEKIKEIDGDTIVEIDRGKIAVARQSLHKKKIIGGQLSRMTIQVKQLYKNNRFLNPAHFRNSSIELIQADMDALSFEGVVIGRTYVESKTGQGWMDYLKKFKSLEMFRQIYQDNNHAIFQRIR